MKRTHVHFHTPSVFSALRLLLTIIRFAVTYLGQLTARMVLRLSFSALANLLRVALGPDNILANACTAVAKGTTPHRGFRSALWVAWSRTLVRTGYRPARLFLDLVALCSTMRPVSRVQITQVTTPGTPQQQQQQHASTVRGSWVRSRVDDVLPRSLSRSGRSELLQPDEQVVVLYMHGGGFRIGNPLANAALFELLLHMWETLWDGEPTSPPTSKAPPPALRSHSHTTSASKQRVQASSGSGSTRVRFADDTPSKVADAQQQHQQQQQQQQQEQEGMDETPQHSGRLPRPASTGVLPAASVVHSFSQQSLPLLAAASEGPQHPHLAWFSLEYDLAPEHKWPMQLQQCLAAYSWLVDQGHSRIFLAGDSAGGNLALTTAICLRDTHADLPQPLGVLAFSPWTNLATDAATYSEGDADILSWNPSQHAEVVDAYLGDSASQLVFNPHVSPQYADLTGLPPLWVSAGDVEMLKPDIDAFVRKARKEGCEVEYVKGRGMYHSYATLYPLMGDAEGLVALQSCIRFLQRALAGSSRP